MTNDTENTLADIIGTAPGSEAGTTADTVRPTTEGSDLFSAMPTLTAEEQASIAEDAIRWYHQNRDGGATGDGADAQHADAMLAQEADMARDALMEHEAYALGLIHGQEMADGAPLSPCVPWDELARATAAAAGRELCDDDGDVLHLATPAARARFIAAVVARYRELNPMPVAVSSGDPAQVVQGSGDDGDALAVAVEGEV